MKSIFCIFCVLFLVTSCTSTSPSRSYDNSESITRHTNVQKLNQKLIRRYPGPNTNNVHTHTGILIQYDQTLNVKDISKDNFQILGVRSEIIHDNDAVVLIPLSPLKINTRYTVSAKLFDKTSTASKDASTRWSFNTGMAPSSPAPQKLPTLSGNKMLLRFPYIQSFKANKVSILWTTRKPGNSKVKYRLGSGGTWSSVKAKQTAFRSKKTGLSYDYFQYETVLSDLEPDTVYEYRVIRKRISLAKGVHFKTLPAAGAEYTHFISFGDSGTKYEEPRAVRDRIITRTKAGRHRYPHDFIAGLGDIAYFTGSYLDFEERFFNQLSARGDLNNGKHSILATRPFVPILGNHEYADNDTATPSAFLTNFSNPDDPVVLKRDLERYYSFDSGPAHFAVIDSMKFLNDHSPGQREMLDWLNRDLSSTKQIWKIIFLHHAIFSNGPHGTYGDMPINSRMRQKLSPILQKHKVQLVINGHDHMYQRSIPLKVSRNGLIIRNRDCSIHVERQGIVYLVVGIGGIDLHTRELDPIPCGSAGYGNIIAEYGDGYDFVATRNGRPVIFDQREAARTGAASGWGFLHVSISRPLLTGVVYNIDGRVLDRFSIIAPLP